MAPQHRGQPERVWASRSALVHSAVCPHPSHRTRFRQVVTFGLWFGDIGFGLRAIARVTRNTEL